MHASFITTSGIFGSGEEALSFLSRIFRPASIKDIDTNRAIKSTIGNAACCKKTASQPNAAFSFDDWPHLHSVPFLSAVLRATQLGCWLLSPPTSPPALYSRQQLLCTFSWPSLVEIHLPLQRTKREFISRNATLNHPLLPYCLPSTNEKALASTAPGLGFLVKHL
jgi:hypothetical protein